MILLKWETIVREKNSDVFADGSFSYGSQRRCQHNQHNTAAFNGPQIHRQYYRGKEYAP